MIAAEYYQLVYLLIIIIISIPVLQRYYNNPNAEDSSPANAVVFTIFITLFMAFRPISDYFADGPGYALAMETHEFEFIPAEQRNGQFAFISLMAFMSRTGFSPRMAYIVLAAVNYVSAYIAFKKLFPKHIMLAMLLYCGTFGVFSGLVNGIKSGCALALFLAALAYRDKIWLCLIFLALSLGFHHSMQISLGAFAVCTLWGKKTKLYYYAWVICLVLAAMHVTYFQTLLANFTDEHGAGYLHTDIDSWVTGFRLDFTLYSSAPLILGLWIMNKVDITGTRYQFFLNVYIVMNCIWLLCMYASFTNRFAALSWALFPLVILEPFLNNRISNNQNKVLVWLVIGVFSFSLLMYFVYLFR